MFIDFRQKLIATQKRLLKKNVNFNLDSPNLITLEDINLFLKYFKYSKLLLGKYNSIISKLEIINRDHFDFESKEINEAKTYLVQSDLLRFIFNIFKLKINYSNNCKNIIHTEICKLIITKYPKLLILHEHFNSWHSDIYTFNLHDQTELDWGVLNPECLFYLNLNCRKVLLVGNLTPRKILSHFIDLCSTVDNDKYFCILFNYLFNNCFTTSSFNDYYCGLNKQNKEYSRFNDGSFEKEYLHNTTMLNNIKKFIIDSSYLEEAIRWFCNSEFKFDVKSNYDFLRFNQNFTFGSYGWFEFPEHKTNCFDDVIAKHILFLIKFHSNKWLTEIHNKFEDAVNQKLTNCRFNFTLQHHLTCNVNILDELFKAVNEYYFYDLERDGTKVPALQICELNGDTTEVDFSVWIKATKITDLESYLISEYPGKFTKDNFSIYLDEDYNFLKLLSDLLVTGQQTESLVINWK